MSKVVKLLASVTWNGSTVAKGNTLELDDISAAALIRDGAAELEEQKAEEQEVEDQETEADIAEVLDMKRKALDAQYKADELKKAAKEAGVEFPYDANKGEVIEAVIKAEKADALLK